MKPAPSNILIVNIRLIGDVILTTPLIGILKDAYPDATIDFLVNRGTGEFLEKDPRVRNVIYAGNENKGDSGKKGGYQGRIFRKYDLAINLNASDRGNIAVVLAGKRARVGFYDSSSLLKSFWQKLMLTNPIPYPDDIPVACYSKLVADALGIPAKKLSVNIFWDLKDISHVNTILDRNRIDGPFYVLHPFARWIYKYWDFKKFAAVSDQIYERYGLKPVWTSSPSPNEKKQLADASALCKYKPVTICGELSLNQITYLISLANLYVGLDTAITHLAASTNTPILALYGPTLTTRWFPWNNSALIDNTCVPPRNTLNEGHILVLQSDMPCVPCGKAGCDDTGLQPSPCLQAISVDKVLLSVDQLASQTDSFRQKVTI